ncbi:serine protease [[Phormidium] sp. ETS-05]|uniref:S1 family peptidase n=1 Tax=[Phormidium] sp. ETS-05 TaxID=222819 RepID=UPI0018EEFFDB|nr:serine protease [[Phormidium] sp. ETS-05]
MNRGIRTIIAFFVLSTASPFIGNSEPPSPETSEIARQITVRILTDSGTGSGVIIQRKKHAYIIVTNRHVVDDHQEQTYTILTPDGQTHQAHLLGMGRGGDGETGGRGDSERGKDDEDIARLQFTCYQKYTVAEIADNNRLNIGDVVYAAGFPSWYEISENKITNTREWGFRAFRWTTGTVGMLPETPLEEGYQLGYTNNIVSGMSGGPILNQQGELVGINGRSAYPLGGIETFKFVDGTFPPEPVFKQMETFSWGIPLDRRNPG